MRAALVLILALTVAAPAAAQDRYGPAPVGNRGRADALPPGMRTLGWSGKVAPTARRAPQEQANLDPLPGGALRQTSVPGATRPLVQPATPSGPPAENAPWRRLTGIPQNPAVDASAPPARPSTPIEAQGLAPPASPSTPDYRTDAAATSTPAAQGDQARYYSLHREYGETPDPVSMPEKTQVFLAGGPLGPRLDEEVDEAEVDTGRTAAANRSRVTADWGGSSDTAAVRRVQITRP